MPDEPMTISNGGNPPRKPGERRGQAAAEPDAPAPAQDTDDSDTKE